jgi:hypothetical protein
LEKDFVEMQVAELVQSVIARLEREEPEKLKELVEKLKEERENEQPN